ncbi:MAG: maleylpyruvate isomerase family mycothiol-dependent enzyme [Acidimicrobiales bacterium]
MKASSRLEPSRYRSLVDADLRTLAATDPSCLTYDIPHLEGWTVHTVIGHTAWIMRYVSYCLQAAPDDPPPRASVGEPPLGAEVFDWFTEAATTVRSLLDTVDLTIARPSWTGPQDGQWWLRRLAQETSMHRWDVQSAVTTPDGIDPDLARDGIDEVLEVFVPSRMHFDALDAVGATIHLHGTDTGPEASEWLLRVTDEAIDREHTHGRADVAVRGTMSDLLLLLWSRVPPSRLEVIGDGSLLDRWQRAATF